MLQLQFLSGVYCIAAILRPRLSKFNIINNPPNKLRDTYIDIHHVTYYIFH